MKNNYSIFSLIKNAFSNHENWQQAWGDPEPKSQYDIVIVGGGGHGLATAYYLAKAHNLKKIAVETDVGLLIESLFMSPLALIVFYLISLDGNYYFSFENPGIAFWLFLAGPMTVIPLFLFLKGVNLAGLGTSGMLFFITPTCQFLMGAFYYNEYFDLNKLIGFIIIWIAVAIYLHDLSREKIRN